MKRCIPYNGPSKHDREKRDEYRRTRNAKARLNRLAQKSQEKFSITDVTDDMDVDPEIAEAIGGSSEV